MKASFLRLLFVASSALVIAPALAQAPAAGGAHNRDAPTLKIIDLAINTHYLATNFDTAEKLLRAAADDCQNQCSPKVLAKVWSYLGIVLATGKNDRTAASDAFIRALSLDPNLKIDAALTTPEVNEILRSLGSTGTHTDATTADAAAGSSLDAPASGLKCTPSVSEVETRRVVPIQCQGDSSITLAQLRYRVAPSQNFVTLKMPKRGNDFVAEIPCTETESVGTLEFYVRAEDASGEDVGAWGNRANPVRIRLVASSKEPPPSYRDQPAPTRCAEKQECPPDFPGCSNKKAGGDVDWGGGCDNSGQCKAGLLCIDGTCENAPSCASDDACSVGRCVEGKCSAIGNADGTSRKHRKNWLGLHVAQDLALVSGNDVCSQSSQATAYWSCYYAGSTSAPYQNDPHAGVRIGGGFSRATTRVLVSYDRVVLSNVTAGVRIGFAFGGGPANGRLVDYAGDPPNVRAEVVKGTRYFPVHLEARVAYWFGRDAFGQRLRPYVHVGGGMAEVDVKFKVPTRDCGPAPASSACLQSASGGKAVELDAWKKLGLEFVTLGGGIAYAMTDWLLLNANLDVMYMFPSTAPVIQPSVGVISGF